MQQREQNETKISEL
jgi:hypothetical protein